MPHLLLGIFETALFVVHTNRHHAVIIAIAMHTTTPVQSSVIDLHELHLLGVLLFLGFGLSERLLLLLGKLGVLSGFL